jgi:hypothetical protein
MQRSRQIHSIRYKSILSGEYQSLEETILEAAFSIGFIALLIITLAGPMYFGIVIKDMKCDERKNDLDCK